MGLSLDSVRRFFSSALSFGLSFGLSSDRSSATQGPDDDVPTSLLQIITPSSIGADRPMMRVLVGGVTLVGIAVAGAVALTSTGVLLAALFAIYLLLSQVLGLQLDVDPSAFVEEAQRYAAQARAN